jgi:hypothetical protein
VAGYYLFDICHKFFYIFFCGIEGAHPTDFIGVLIPYVEVVFFVQFLAKPSRTDSKNGIAVYAF